MEELILELKKVVDAGTKKSELEESIGLPKNSLSAVLSGAKDMPESWVSKIKDFLTKPLAEPVEIELSQTIKVISKGELSLAPSKEAIQRGKDAMDKINKDFGEGSIMRLGDKPMENVRSVPTGSLGLDHALGIGGLPRGRIIEIYGPESCLDADTFIQYEIKTKDGKRQNHKGGSIKRLYERFHGFDRPGQGFYQRSETKNSDYYAPCMNEEGRIFQNKIIDVAFTGQKDCFIIRTIKGYSITATAEHKFYTGDKYVRLSDLKIGDILMVHNCTPFQKESTKQNHRKYAFVKSHPIAGVKVIDEKYIYNRIANSRLVYESYLNNIPKEEYIQRLNNNDLVGLKFLSREDHVHHIDEDHTNDALSNLVLLKASDHGRLHAMERHNNLRYTVVPDEIISIESVGNKETYDIRMEQPFNNYVADKFVVHNSGKTTVALHVIAEAQKRCGNCAFIDVEHAFDETYAKAIGVNIDELHFSQPDYGEQALEEADRLIASGAFSVIVIDSIAALVPKAELEGEMGDSKMGLQARLMSQACRKLTAAISKTSTVCIFINQLRATIGNMYGPQEITTGGNALKFYASIRLDVRKVAQLKDGDEAYGNRVRVKVVKNKVASPFKNCEYDIVFGQGIDKIGELVEIAANLGIIKKAGAWYSYNDAKLGQGKEAAKQLLKDNLSLLEEIQKLTKEELKNR